MATTKYPSIHTGPEIDAAVARALAGGEIDTQQKSGLESKYEIEFLDNTDFTNPIAQAGIGGNHGSVAYALDRWKLISGTVSGSANGLTLNGTIRQIRENPIGFSVIPSVEMYSGTATITYDDSTKYCDIVSSGGVIKRPHLGLRAITDWTKMPVIDSDDGLEKYQKHYVKISANGIYPGYTIPGYTTVAFFIPLPRTMRTVPAVNIATLGTIVVDGSATADLTYSGVNISENGVRISMVASTAYTAWGVAVWANPVIELIADIE